MQGKTHRNAGHRNAGEDPRIGYMNRLKEYWEEIQSELNYFSSKKLKRSC